MMGEDEKRIKGALASACCVVKEICENRRASQHRHQTAEIFLVLPFFLSIVFPELSFKVLSLKKLRLRVCLLILKPKELVKPD